MLFTQLAMAGHACPNLTAAPPSAAMAMAMDDGGDQAMAGCMGSDKMQPGLCHAQDQSGNQSLDKPAAPHVAPFLASALAAVFRNIELARTSAVPQFNALLLTRSTAPPLSIRNCCFRI
jgi:hypothetical protein